MRLYVYALVSPGLAEGTLGTGLTDEPLRVLSLGPFDAVVGEMEDRPSIAPASLGTHDEVLRRLGAASDAILPLPFGALVNDAAELRDGLAPRLGVLAEALEATRGCDQMTLRVYAAPSFAMSAVHDALRPVSRLEKTDPRSSPTLRATLFHLVERGRVPEYRARVERLGATLAGARLDVTGPWLPYAFTELG